MSMRVQGLHSLVQRVEMATRNSAGHGMCGLLIASDGRHIPTQYFSTWDGAQRCLMVPRCLRMYLLLSAAPSPGSAGAFRAGHLPVHHEGAPQRAGGQ
jgi:hypothetical protein